MARNFSMTFASVVFALLSAVLLVNLFVDPYNRFGLNRLGVYISAEREFKGSAVTRYPHNALLLGNSKPLMIDPLQLEGWDFFNGCFAGALPEEIYAFVDRYAHDQDLVVIGLDFGMFNETLAPLKAEPLERKLSADIPKYLWNFQSLIYSARTVFYAIRGREVRTLPAGNMNSRPIDADELHFPEPSYEHAFQMLRNEGFSDFQFSKTRMEKIEKIRELLAARNIKLVLYLNPEHHGVQEIIREMGLGEVFDQWRQDLRVIFPELIDLTTSEFTADEFYYRHDPVHYKPASGARFMKERVLPEPSP